MDWTQLYSSHDALTHSKHTLTHSVFGYTEIPWIHGYTHGATIHPRPLRNTLDYVQHQHYWIPGFRTRKKPHHLAFCFYFAPHVASHCLSFLPFLASHCVATFCFPSPPFFSLPSMTFLHRLLRPPYFLCLFDSAAF